MTGRDKAPKPVQDSGPKGFDDYELVLGDILRGERATMGKSLLDVQRDIKVKASYIAAIEDCDLDAFETPGFIAGYVRSYGRYLGLDPELVYQAFCEQSGFSHVEGLEARVQVQPKSKARGARGRARGRVASVDAILARNPIHTAPKTARFTEIRPGAVASMAALVALLGGLGYGAWSVLQSIQRVTLAPVETPVVALNVGPDLDLDTGTATETAVTSPSGEALMKLYRPQVLDAPVMIARDGPISTLDPDAQGSFAGQGHRSEGAVDFVALTPGHPGAPDTLLPPLQGPLPDQAGQPVQLAEAGDVTVVAPPAPEVVLFAREPVWMRVRAADGTVLAEKTLAAGERYVLPQTEAPPSLRSGNSGALFFAVNGRTLGPAGPAGSVTKAVELSAAALTERYQPVDMEADPELRRLAELVIAPDRPPVQ